MQSSAISAFGLSLALSASLAAPSRAADAAAADTSVSSTNTLGEVIVTAEKHAENLQQTAAAVTAISADDLLKAGVTDLRQVQQFVPSAGFRAEGDNTQLVIRGVGSTLDFQNVEPLVAFNFADVYLPREADTAALFDLARIEVLPGPQGTLYGRSAVGGTINLSPVRPGFDNDGRTILEVGNYAAIHATVTQDFKASDTLAFRAAVDYNRRDGVEKTGADSLNDGSVRLSTLFEPNERLTVFAWAQGTEKGGHSANLVNKGTDPVTGTYCEPCYLHQDPWDDTRTGQFAGPFGVPVPEPNHYREFVAGGRIDYRFADVTLSYIPSYLYLDSDPLYWLSAIRSQNSAHYNQISQELRLTSTAPGPLQWLGGLYFYNQRNSGVFTLFLPLPSIQDDVALDRMKGYAAFGQMTYSITRSFRTIVGARYSVTERAAYGNSPAAVGSRPYDFDQSYRHVDWKVSLEKDLTQRVMAYAAVQTGYEPGTFNEIPNSPTFNNAVRPSRLLAYSAGIKSRWLGDRLQVNDEVYYYDYRDLLMQSFSVTAATNLLFNARKVAIKGNQLSVLARVFTRDQVNLDVGYLHARNVDFVTPSGQNYDGLQLAYSPDVTATAGYTHNIPVGSGLLSAHIGWHFESSWFGDYQHDLGTRQAPWNKGDASLTYDAGSWSLGAWIENIQNRAVIAATAAAGIPGPATSYLDQPRTYGVRFTVEY